MNNKTPEQNQYLLDMTLLKVNTANLLTQYQKCREKYGDLHGTEPVEWSLQRLLDQFSQDTDLEGKLSEPSYSTMEW